MFWRLEQLVCLLYFEKYGKQASHGELLEQTFVSPLLQLKKRGRKWQTRKPIRGDLYETKTMPFYIPQKKKKRQCLNSFIPKKRKKTMPYYEGFDEFNKFSSHGLVGFSQPQLMCLDS